VRGGRNGENVRLDSLCWVRDRREGFA
jgi:hypothetical protein